MGPLYPTGIFCIVFVSVVGRSRHMRNFLFLLFYKNSKIYKYQLLKIYEGKQIYIGEKKRNT